MNSALAELVLRARRGGGGARCPHTGSCSQARPRRARMRAGRSRRRPRESPSPSRRRSSGCARRRSIGVALLRGDARRCEDRVGVLDRADDLLGVDRLLRFERHAEVVLGAQPLKVVHVVGDGAAGSGFARRGGSSTPPGPPPARQQRASRCAGPPRCAGRGSLRAARLAAVGSPSIASAWSEWVAMIDLVKALGLRPGGVQRAPDPASRARSSCTGVRSRIRSRNGAVSAST